MLIINIGIMCLTIKSKSEMQPEPKVAEKDINVYKVLRREFRLGESKFITPYMGHKINFSDGKWVGDVGALYPLESSEYDMRWEVHTGLHAYKTKVAAQADVRNSEMYSNIFFPHCNDYEMVICKAYIPKGARYYIGTKDDIVSDRLVVENVTV